MSAVDARKEHYEAVEILGIPGLFTTLRVDRTTIPKGVYAYDMQTSEQDWSQPCLLARHITVEHFGTVLTANGYPQSNDRPRKRCSIKPHPAVLHRFDEVRYGKRNQFDRVSGRSGVPEYAALQKRF